MRFILAEAAQLTVRSDGESSSKFFHLATVSERKLKANRENAKKIEPAQGSPR